MASNSKITLPPSINNGSDMISRISRNAWENGLESIHERGSKIFVYQRYYAKIRLSNIYMIT